MFLGKVGNSQLTSILLTLPTSFSIRHKCVMWLASEGTWAWRQLHPDKSHWNNYIRDQVYLQGHYELCDSKKPSYLSLLPLSFPPLPRTPLTRNVIYQITGKINYSLGKPWPSLVLVSSCIPNISWHNLGTIFLSLEFIFFPVYKISIFLLDKHWISLFYIYINTFRLK